MAIPQPKQKKCVCGLIMMGDLPEWKRERVVSLLWVTYPGGRMASFLWVTYPGKKKWRMVSFLWVTYPEKIMVSL